MKILCEKYDLNEAILLAGIKKSDADMRYFLRKIPLDDILQSLRYEMCNGAQNQQELYRNCHRALRQLLNDFGFGYYINRKEFPLRYTEDGELNEQDISDIELVSGSDRKLIENILAIYDKASAKDACQLAGVQYNSTIASAFNRYFPKNMGHGGRRTGSGNRKGWKNKEK